MTDGIINIYNLAGNLGNIKYPTSIAIVSNDPVLESFVKIKNKIENPKNNTSFLFKYFQNDAINIINNIEKFANDTCSKKTDDVRISEIKLNENRDSGAIAFLKNPLFPKGTIPRVFS